MFFLGIIYKRSKKRMSTTSVTKQEGSNYQIEVIGETTFQFCYQYHEHNRDVLVEVEPNMFDVRMQSYAQSIQNEFKITNQKVSLDALKDEFKKDLYLLKQLDVRQCSKFHLPYKMPGYISDDSLILEENDMSDLTNFHELFHFIFKKMSPDRGSLGRVSRAGLKRSDAHHSINHGEGQCSECLRHFEVLAKTPDHYMHLKQRLNRKEDIYVQLTSQDHSDFVYFGRSARVLETMMYVMCPHTVREKTFNQHELCAFSLTTKMHTSTINILRHLLNKHYINDSWKHYSRILRPGGPDSHPYFPYCPHPEDYLDMRNPLYLAYDKHQNEHTRLKNHALAIAGDVHERFYLRYRD